MKLRPIIIASIASAAIMLVALQTSCGVAPNPSTAKSTAPAKAVPARHNDAVEGTRSGHEAAPSTGPVAAAGSTTAPVAAKGKHSVLVMMVNWTRPDATTPAAAQNVVGVDVNNWYAAVSYNQMGFTATATPWMTVAKSDCSLASAGYWNLLTLAENQAKARGFNPSAYNHEMVYFPYDAHCDFGGLGTTGDRYTWVNGEMTTRVTAHELGHNLGLHHSSSATCYNGTGAQVVLSGFCSHDEYGDLFDAMGAVYSGTPRSFNAAQKARLGWLDGHATTVTTSRSVILSPLENSAGTVAARIVAGGREYWVEYRRAIGVDGSLGFYPGATDGVLVHRTTTEGATELLDGRPDGYRSFANAAVPTGRSITTPEGVNVKVRSVSSSSAVVDILFARAPK